MDAHAEHTRPDLRWQELASTSDARVVAERHRPRWVRELWFWLGQVVFWGLNLLLQSVIVWRLLAPTADLPGKRTLVLTRFATGMLSTLVLRSLYHRLGRAAWPIRQVVMAAVVLILLTASLELALFQTILDWVLGAEVIAQYSGLISFHLTLLYRVQALVIWSICYTGLLQASKVRNAEIRAVQAETALRTSELDRLEAQLQPHFLFNALTAVLACRHDPDAVTRVTTGLSEYLRFTLSRGANLEPLGRELEGLEHLLVVQRERFGGALACQIQCEPRARDVLVPSMLVSPLLDNALKYGAQTTTGPLTIAVDCRVERDTLLVTVSNSGTWIQPGSSGRLGTGLQNLRGRLDLLGLEQAQLQCLERDGVVQVRVTIPLERALSRGRVAEPDGHLHGLWMPTSAWASPQSKGGSRR